MRMFNTFSCYPLSNVFRSNSQWHSKNRKICSILVRAAWSITFNCIMGKFWSRQTTITNVFTSRV